MYKYVNVFMWMWGVSLTRVFSSFLFYIRSSKSIKGGGQGSGLNGVTTFARVGMVYIDSYV